MTAAPTPSLHESYYDENPHSLHEHDLPVAVRSMLFVMELALTHSHGASMMERGAQCFLDEYRNPRYNRGFRSRHSQHSEDLLLLPTLLALANRARPKSLAARFVELGALDGVSISNTFLLERCFNWTGVLIEANPDNFAALNRSRRTAAKVHAAACPLGTSVTLSARGGPTSSVLNKAAVRTDTVSVPCRPLSLIMQENLPSPHGATFLSLDVEGAEAIVLATVDPAKFDLILVEYGVGQGPTGAVAAKDAEVDRLITAAGLRLAPAQLALSRSRVYVKDPNLVYPFRDSRDSALNATASDGAFPLVRHARYTGLWRPSDMLKASNLASLLREYITRATRGQQSA